MSKVKKEILRFLVAGICAVGTDFGGYYLLLNFWNHNASKMCSFLLGTLVAFVINKYWTFERLERNTSEIWKFGILYASSLGANILINHLILSVTELSLIAFLCATGTSTIINFLGQKFWVFK